MLDLKKKADLGQFMSLPKIVGFLNVVIAQQVGGNLGQSVAYLINGVIGQRYTSKL